MRQSELFSTTRKEAPKDEVSRNAQLLIRGGYVDKLMAGVYSFLPLGLRVMKKIETIIREEMTNIAGQEVLLPTLQPKSHWETTGRLDTYDSLFRFTSFFTKSEYILGPTHEEVIAPLMTKFNLSYKNLPIYIFQIQNKFRDEARAKSGLLRGREFFMKDLYSFHVREEKLEEYYEKVKDAYKTIFDRAGIGHVTYLTFASGGTFSKYSHEYQTLTMAGEDTIYLCKKCDVAVNDEIIEDQKHSCPECGEGNLVEEKAVEVGNIFKLKTKYSEPFGLTFRDEDGSEKPMLMGCYGIGLNRLMGTIVEVHHDDDGIVWPESVAPFRVHLMHIGKGDDVRTFADGVYGTLTEKGVEVLYDDRVDASAGEKFADADLLGFPWRVVVSEKTMAKDGIEIKRRSEKDAKVRTVSEFLGEL